jgi:hypothetical protein
VLQKQTALPMAGVMTFCAAAAFMAFTLGRKYLIKRKNNELTYRQDIEIATAV